MSDPQIRKIADRLKTFREENDMSVEWASKAIGVTADELESYESGEADIPVSFLYIAAQKYGVELSTLLTGEEPHEQKFNVVRKGEGIAVNRQREYQYQSLCADFAHKKMEPLLVTVEAKSDDTPLSFNEHPGQEFHYILEGRMQVTIEDQEIILNPGDSLMFNSEHPHALKALDNKPVRFLAIIL